MKREAIESKSKEVLGRILKLDPCQIDADFSQENLASWDSVRHMNVVLGLENEFEIEFADAELPHLTSLELIVDAIERQLRD